MEKYNIIMEKVWLILAAGSAIYASYMWIEYGLGSGTQTLLLITVIAFAYYLTRRFMRRRMEKLMEDKENERNAAH